MGTSPPPILAQECGFPGIPNLRRPALPEAEAPRLRALQGCQARTASIIDWVIFDANSLTPVGRAAGVKVAVDQREWRGHQLQHADRAGDDAPDFEGAVLGDS
jgi:hypothetical protein